ncbi:YlbF/YmcA family competence regulator [Streptococcus sp. SGI.013]|uniref:YlbF/YmcA family competence regulator n=1 Tax=unclassified Streptococcus TaxID=2608887 RepID=UPI003CFBD3AF
MSTNVYDLANELERAIRLLPEYKAVEEAKQQIEADSAAQSLWSDFVAMQEKMQGLMQTGQMPSQEDQTAMMELGQKIEANSILKNYFDQQQRLSIYIADIEKIVFAPLQELVK